MLNEVRNAILAELAGDFDYQQLQKIDHAIGKGLRGYKLEPEETLPAPLDSTQSLLVREFLARKKMKGCSEGTIKQYEFMLGQFVAWARKSLTEMTDLDILMFLDYIQSTSKMSALSLNNIRLILSSFYTFLHDSGKMATNPMKTVDPIKYRSKVREPLTDMEMEAVRFACNTPKERALVEVLYSTGSRVSEIVSMNWRDIDTAKRRMVVTGKGDKQRYVFFNAKALFFIQKYLDSRTDNNEALFVKDNQPHSRLTKAGIEYIITQLGKRAELGRPLFPHLFRHTFATDMLSNGAPINEVSRILGHEKIETTMIYAKESVDDLALSHKKHIA